MRKHVKADRCIKLKQSNKVFTICYLSCDTKQCFHQVHLGCSIAELDRGEGTDGKAFFDELLDRKPTRGGCPRLTIEAEGGLAKV